MTAETILKLIESVDLDDTDTLDEIDARVWCWMNDEAFIRGLDSKKSVRFLIESKFYKLRDGQKEKSKKTTCAQYTRSRDALKSIRPEGWGFTEIHSFESGWQVLMENDEVYVGSENKQYFKTEELAELHAIIQAIEYERQDK